MAKPVSTIRDVEGQNDGKKDHQLRELENLLSSHTEDVEQLFRVVHLLQEKGLLDVAAAALEQGQDLLEILVRQANGPGSLGGIKSLIAVVQGMTKLDASVVSAVFTGLGKASQVIAGGEAEEISGLWDIVRVMRDSDVTTGLTAIFAILKAVGQQLNPTGSTGESSQDLNFSSPTAKTV
ncbi:DUF1641 domain-containing protein [Alicyclobacillus sp. SO9]|uniref:DUF1641 domain-containing protein n=1 Tax=Alicyclobacillus sp. SO9 TaxID=2665646 RepID=UPI0018E8FB34|nr:DUF1641 domain-containing protein [Alicyclobacillus sp. SO9]QQE80655.1 DUF1641 domain-containing protein [Alicyclobacillus sp. SO9]